MLVDSHCHLEYEGLVEDRRALDRARSGVEASSTFRRSGRMGQVVGTARPRDVYAGVGIHPHNADDHAD